MQRLPCCGQGSIQHTSLWPNWHYLIGTARLGTPSNLAPKQANICTISILHDLVSNMTRHQREPASFRANRYDRLAEGRKREKKNPTTNKCTITGNRIIIKILNWPALTHHTHESPVDLLLSPWFNPRRFWSMRGWLPTSTTHGPQYPGSLASLPPYLGHVSNGTVQPVRKGYQQ